MPNHCGSERSTASQEARAFSWGPVMCIAAASVGEKRGGRNCGSAGLSPARHPQRHAQLSVGSSY
jgi:hypothetical protein